MLTTSFPRNSQDDAGIFIARLVEALQQKSIEGAVFCPDDEKCGSEPNFKIWKLVRLKYSFLFKQSLAYGSGILPNIKANPFLVLQIPGLLLSFLIALIRDGKQYSLVHANWIVTALPAIIAKKFISKPLLVTVRGEDLKLLYLPLIGKILIFFLKKADAISAVSQDFADKLKTIFPDKQIYLTANGATKIQAEKSQVDFVRQEFGLNNDPYLIYAGRIIPLKRVELLIKILSQLENKQIKLVLCGSLRDAVYVDSLKKLSADLGVSNRLIFLGQVDPKKYLYLLSAAKFYCSASEYEGRPNSVLESLVNSVPCILSDISAHRDLIGSAGYLFEADQLESVALNINKALNSQDLYENLRKQTEFLSHSGWQNSAEQYLAVYNKLLGIADS